MGNDEISRSVTPPGWYPSPDGRPVGRWWNGSAWEGPERPIDGTRPRPPADQARARLRGLPWWGQALAWVLIWPALLGLLLWRSGRGGVWGKVAAVAIAVLITPTWLAAPFTDDSQPAADLAQEEAEATSAPTPEPSTPTLSPTRSPTPTPTATPTEASSPSPPPTATAEESPAPKLPDGVPEGAQAGVVERIVDGDTIWVRIDQEGGPLQAEASHNIRLLEIDTPETVAPGEPVQCWGPEATAFAEETIPVGSTVYLLPDVEDRDSFGRFLRYVWTEDGVFFNLEAVKQGHARVVLYEPNDAYIDQVQAAEAEAQAANLGMWGPPCDYDAPTPDPEPEPETEAPVADTEPEGDCEPGYDPCVPRYPPDVNCSDVNDPITVTGPDPHGLDRDGDGVGCE